MRRALLWTLVHRNALSSQLGAFFVEIQSLVVRVGLETPRQKRNRF